MKRRTRGGTIYVNRVSGRDPVTKGFDTKIRGSWHRISSPAQVPLYAIVMQSVGSRSRRKKIR